MSKTHPDNAPPVGTGRAGRRIAGLRARAIQGFVHPRFLAVMGSGFGQIFLFIATAIVSRVYTPDQLSSYGVFFALFSMLLIATMLRIEQAVVYSSNDDEANDLKIAALAALPLVLLIIAYPTYYYLHSNPQTTDIALPLVLALLIALAGGGLSRLQMQLIARADAFRYLALTNFLRPAFIAFMQFGAALIGAGMIRLPVALALSQCLLVIATVLVARRVWKSRALDRRISRIWGTLRKHIDFVRYNLPQNLLFVASESVVPLSISFLFPGDNAVALFWLASRVVFAPANIFAESIRAQIYRIVARDAENRFRFVMKTVLALFVLISMPVALIAVAGEPLFQIAFGDRWGAASEYALVLGMLVAVNVSSLPLVGAVPVLALQKHYTVMEAIGLLVRIGLFFAVPWQSAFESVLVTSLAYIVLQIAFMSYVARILAQRKST